MDSLDATIFTRTFNQLQEVNTTQKLQHCIRNPCEYWLYLQQVSAFNTFLHDCLKEWFVQASNPTDKRLSADSRVITFEKSPVVWLDPAPKSSPLMVQQRSQLASGHLLAVPSAQNTGIPFHTRRTPGSQYFQISREVVVRVIIGTYTGHHLYYSKLIELFE